MLPGHGTMQRAGRDFIARHGETVFNAARRLQGDAPHTPLTRAGIAQADEMGRALRATLGTAPPLTLWASPTGRALQTLAIVAEHLALDWHAARTDPRLTEIGMGAWGGRYYADVVAEVGPVVDERGLLRPAPDGERYDAVAERVSGWLADTADDAGDRIVITHGIAGRVLRGVMTGAPIDPCGAPVLPGHPQGTVTMIARGVETIVHLGTGRAPAVTLALMLAAKVAIGVWGRWGAFRDGSRCYAIAAPIRAAASGRAPFASVVPRFGRDRRAAIYIRLSAPRSTFAPVTLAIGDRRFGLSANDAAAWSPDAATDRAIVAAMRGSRSMSVSAVSARGRPFADTYALTGAATAIDAAWWDVGCRILDFS